MEKKISKKLGIGIFWVVALIAGTIIALHQNPNADPGEELLKKVISCGVILVSCLIFSFLDYGIAGRTLAKQTSDLETCEK